MASELFPSVVRGSAASPPVRTGFEIGRVARFGGNINCNELEIRIGGKSIASATAQKDTYLFSTKSGRRLETEQREQKILRGYGQFTDSVSCDGPLQQPLREPNVFSTEQQLSSN